MQDKILSLISLAAKAGRIASGGFQVEEAIAKRRACLVILTCDASKNTVRDIENKCEYYHIPFCRYSTKEDLGRSIGRGQRSCAAVTDQGFADHIYEKIRQIDSNRESGQ